MFAGDETILLVEDDEHVREAIRASLHSYGYHVLAAPAGREALAVSAEHADEIALLITDVVMPRMSGRELAKHLLATRPGMQVLYISGYTHEVIIGYGALEHGAEFLQKPFTTSVLCGRVRTLLDLEPELAEHG